ncbi:hypothetical protein C8Q75DRAFT_754203 [Abortiporus biennis]|nr:hypothetical protein C8Q75DRAFT_754203 [Abortiporus biennis]
MYPALYIPEVVQAVSDYLADQTPDGGTSSTRGLLAFALTCRRFLVPAIVNLWSSIQTTYPLTCVFPEDLFKEVEEDDGKMMVPTRQIRPSDWVRCDFYTQHVRVFAAIRSKSENQELSTLSLQMFILHRNQPLFLNLRELVWQYPSPLYTQLSSLFLSPSLTFVSVTIFSEFSAIAIMGYLREICPLVSFAMVKNSSPGYISEQRTDLHGSICSAILSWSSLTVIAMPTVALNESSLLHIASLPKLENASLRLDSGFDAQDCVNVHASGSTGTSFQCLSAFHVIMSSEAVISGAAILRSITSKTLRKLQVEIEGIPTEESIIASCTEAISKHRCLEILELHCEAPETAHEANPVAFSFNGIRHLMCNHKIIQLFMEMNVNLSDDDAHQLAASWPSIQSFTLLANDSIPTEHITIYGVRQFAFHCPQLQYLHIPLDARVPDIPDLRHLPMLPMRDDALSITPTTLPSPGEETMKFAAIMSALFLNVDIEISDEWYTILYTKKKREYLTKLIKKFSSVRRFERSRMEPASTYQYS